MNTSTKTPYNPAERRFDLKILLCGNSGSGKTHLAATYLAGPIHFYMLDKGGEKTLDKLVQERPSDAPPITIDLLAGKSYSAVWRTLQQDERSGFFTDLAAAGGLVVFDSLTSANRMAIEEIQRLDSITPAGPGSKVDNKKGMSMPHWGQLLNWMESLVSALQSLPCAAIVTVHLHTLMDSDQQVAARYPSVNGQFRQTLGKDFDEVYLLETRGTNHIIVTREKAKFEAKSRVFSCGDLRNVDMQILADTYLAGQTNPAATDQPSRRAAK